MEKVEFVNEIIHGDCLDILRKIKDKTVDAVITDPPYGIDYQSARRTDPAKRHKKIENDTKPFIWWLHEAYRITKSDGTLICFCRWDVQEAFKKAIEWAGFTVKSQVIWDRGTHGMGDLESSFAPRHDVIWFAVKGDFKFPAIRPQSVIRAQRVDGESLLHPNEKPLPLMESLIESVTKKGDIVCDPFSGSGSTAVACLGLGRRFIVIEKDLHYVEIGQDRLRFIQSRIFV